MTRRTFVTGCAAAAAASRMSAAGNADAQFAGIAGEYISATLANRPEFATMVGDHRYDDRLNDYSTAGRARTLAVDQHCLERVNALTPEALDVQDGIDCRILRNRAESQVWDATVLRTYAWDPMIYNPGGSLYLLLERDFAPLPVRLKSLRGRLDAIPAMLAAAKQNLTGATHIHTETALLQNAGLIALVRDVVSEHAAKVPGAREDLAPAQARAVAALDDWGRWLEQDLLPRAHRDFRLGPELYRIKLRHTLDAEITPDQIRERAGRDLERAQEEIYRTAVMLYQRWSPNADVSDRKHVVRAVLDKLAENRPTAETIVPEAERVLREATELVRAKELVTVPATPLRIVVMPEFERGVAVANCNSPGPLEKNGATFLNISPPPAKWSATQVASYFREYNDYMVRDLIAHEAMPGHYLQLAHANEFRAATMVRAIFDSGPFVEGWAVYGERLMADNGFGGPEVRMQQLKMWLRTIINALLDVGIHDGNMTEQQAMALMMDEGYQEQSEAAGKWRRACLTSAQLPTYWVGATALFELRDDYQKKHGPIQDWKAFHDRMLSFGSPPPRYVRELML